MCRRLVISLVAKASHFLGLLSNKFLYLLLIVFYLIVPLLDLVFVGFLLVILQGNHSLYVFVLLTQVINCLLGVCVKV